MLVTGVQSVGAKGVTAIQGTVIDLKSATRSNDNGNHDADRGAGAPFRAGDPQPVVFPRSGAGIDQRPSAMRHQDAIDRYRAYGGTSAHGHHDDAA